MNETLSIRPFQPEDLPALLRVEASASSRYQEAGFSLAEAPPRDEEELNRLTNETTVIVAEIDGAVVGYGSYFVLGPYLHLEELAVGRVWQGRGIGRRLAEAYLGAALPVARCSHYSLIAFQAAEWAVGLYRRIGFVSRDVYPGALPHPELLDQLVAGETAAGFDASRRQLMIRPKLNAPDDRGQAR
jgi:ribosomal protein S18 acetylase RimI-like enzyme